MGNVFTALGAFWTYPLAKFGGTTEILYEGTTAEHVDEVFLLAKRRGGRVVPPRLRRASAATAKWAQEKAVSFGFLSTLFVAVCGLSAGFLIKEPESPLIKICIGVLGAIGGYVVLLLVLTAIFWFVVGPKPAAA